LARRAWWPWLTASRIGPRKPSWMASSKRLKNSEEIEPLPTMWRLWRSR